MKLLRIVLVLLPFLCSYAEEDAGIEFEKDDGIYILTDKNFDSFLLKHPTTMVEFYAPW